MSRLRLTPRPNWYLPDEDVKYYVTLDSTEGASEVSEEKRMTEAELARYERKYRLVDREISSGLAGHSIVPRMAAEIRACWDERKELTENRDFHQLSHEGLNELLGEAQAENERLTEHVELAMENMGDFMVEHRETVEENDRLKAELENVRAAYLSLSLAMG